MENYEQKYERALKQAKKELEACGSLDCDAARQIFRLFPDLRKSEDELIREELIHFLETCRDPRFVGNRKQDKWISWLDKQGAQKPIDKIEPKFKVGDFIVHNNSGNVCQVTEIKDDKYCIWPLYAEVEGYLSFIDVDNDYHLWAIQDAKDGDVLVCEDKISKIKNGQEIGIVKNYVGRIGGCYNCFETYCFIDWDGNFRVSEAMGSPNIHPATKEQRDLLFQKMEEAGYELDADKKELKRIEQNHAYNWNELTWEDIVTLEGIINNVHYEFRNGIGQESFGKEVLERFRETKGDEYMDSCGQNPAWTEEDEEMIDAVIADIQFTQKAHNHEVNQIVYERKIDWLKSLKQRLNGTE